AGGQVAQRPGQGASQNNPVQPVQTGGVGAGGITPQGGVIGVTSKSKEASIKQYNGRSRYNEWTFVYLQTAQRPGQPGVPPGAPGPAGQGGRQGQGPQPFGMQQPNMPPGFGQPNRPPIGMPGQMPGQPFPNQQNPNTINGPGGTTITPLPPGPRRPGGQ
ncbi:MAG TPA: hypothetical protein VNT81_24490, partial [Vicinamibacterales bacterium]|nr:hypothetical protein [Vicinamibacterales bacterium]